MEADRTGEICRRPANITDYQHSPIFGCLVESFQLVPLAELLHVEN